MNDLFYGFTLDYGGRVTITPVKCADGKWRWAIVSFEDPISCDPGLLDADDPETLFNTTDEDVHPELYTGEPLDLDDSDWMGDMGDV